MLERWLALGGADVEGRLTDLVRELDPHDGRATRFSGGWSAFERERAAVDARALAEHEQALAHRGQLIAAERDTRRRAAASADRARGRVHDNDSHMREWVTMRADGTASRARTMGGRARRVEVPEGPRAHAALRLRPTVDERRRPWVVGQLSRRTPRSPGRRRWSRTSEPLPGLARRRPGRRWRRSGSAPRSLSARRRRSRRASAREQH
jgi:hypothetical protein